MKPLKESADFARILREGRRARLNDWVTFCWAPARPTSSDNKESRFGYILPRRFANAVVRNRTRRVFRSALREAGIEFSAQPIDGAFLFRPHPSFRPLRDLEFKNVKQLVGMSARKSRRSNEQ